MLLKRPIASDSHTKAADISTSGRRLSYYTEQGWVVHASPLIVGIRGMIDSSHVESLLKFLDIPRKHWHVAIEKIALASVQAFHFLHRVRFAGPLERV